MKITDSKQVMEMSGESGKAFESHDDLEKFMINVLRKKYRKELVRIKTRKQAKRLGEEIIKENTIYDFFKGGISRGIMLKGNVRVTCSMRSMGDIVAKLLNKNLGREEFNYIQFYMVFPADSIADYSEVDILKKIKHQYEIRKM